MSGRVAEGRLEVRQIYCLLQHIHEGDKMRIEKMTKLGVKNLINLKEPQDGIGALHVAVAANNEGLVSFLLSKGAQPDIQDKKGRTAVMLAAEQGNDAVVAMLAQSHASFRLQDNEGKGVLFYCIYPTQRHTSCLKMALQGQADVNNVSNKGIHVFQLMCEKAKDCTEMCLLMLKGGAEPNATNKNTGVTALMEAAKAGSLDLVRAILKKGGSPNAMDGNRTFVIHYAAMGGCFEVTQVLSAYSANFAAIDMDECTPLHYAAASGDENSCRFLAQRGCNAKLKNQEGLLPRQIAKNAGHKAAFKELKKAQAPQGKDKGSKLMSDLWALTLHDWTHENQNELLQATGNKEKVNNEMLITVLEQLKAPVEPDQLQTVISVLDEGNVGSVKMNEFIKGDRYIKKPFLIASYMPKVKKGGKKGKGGKKKGKSELPMPICTLPPEQMPRRQDGGPPQFMIEPYNNYSDIQKPEHDYPPEHPIMNDSGWYKDKSEKVYVNINYCVKSGDLASLDLAFSQGVPVDVVDQFYKTPLTVACSSGNYEVAQYLLSRGADVDACDQFFWTPLHHAAHAGQVEIIQLLLDAGATIDAETIYGGTPLMRAIQSSQLSCVDFLIKAGADKDAENKKGQNCLQIANDFSDTRIIDLIKEGMDSQEKTKGKGGNAKPAKGKSTARASEVHKQPSTAAAGKLSPRKDSKSVILQNTRITVGKTNTMDITFKPKTVWGKPPTTTALMSTIGKRKELLSLELDDFMMPFHQSIQKKILEPPKNMG